MNDKVFITEDEFDDLNYHKQMYYKYCPICGMFYCFNIIDECDHPYRYFKGGVKHAL